MFSIYADGQLVCSSSVFNEDKYAIDTDASITTEIDNKAGSFNFSVLPTHYLFDYFAPYLTRVDVYQDNYCLFTGRVTTTTITQENRTVYCEGALSYFNDSVQFKFELKTTTPRMRFKEIIDAHNEQVDIFKRFYIGQVDNKDADTDQEFEVSGAEDTFSVLTSDLTDRFGGYLLVHKEDSRLIIDWIDNYDHTCSQPISFGKNLITYSENDGVNDAWSILYPTASGEDNVEYNLASVNNGSIFYELPDRIAKYGRIVKELSFSDVTSDEELLEETKKWLEKNDLEDEPTVTLSVIDYSILDDSQRFAIGDTISFRRSYDDPYRSLICSKIEYSLFKPGQINITLGIPPRSFSDVYFSDASTTNDRLDSLEGGLSETNSDAKKLSNRVAQNERDIVVNANSITANANQITLNAKQIALNADLIAANAKEIEINAEKIRTNADSIEVHTKELSLKASDADLVWLRENYQEYTKVTDDSIEGLKQEDSRLATQLGAVDIEINGGEGYIGLKAQYAQLWGDQQDLVGDMDGIRDKLSEVGGYVNDLSLELDAQAGEIRLKASQLALDEATDRITAAEAAIVVNYNYILLKASQSDVDALGNRVTNAEASIQVNKDSIALKADQYGVDQLGNRVTAAEASIQVNTDSITSKVSKGDIASTINQTAQSVQISASKIDLSGYVTASELSAEIAEIKKLFSDLSVSGNAVITGSLNAGSASLGSTIVSSLSVGGYGVHPASMDVVTNVKASVNESKGHLYAYSTSTATNKSYFEYVAGVSVSISKDTDKIYYWSWE